MAESLEKYLEGLRSLDKFQRVARAVREGGRMTVGGLYGSSPAVFLAALRPDLKGTLLVASAGVRDGNRFRDDLLHFYRPDEVALFPPWDAAGEKAEDADTFSKRLELLSRFVAGAPPAVVVAPVRALVQDVVPPEAVRKNTRWIRVGEDLDLKAFLPWLESRDMRRVPMAETGGEWSLRGSILDVFPYSSQRPFRIELFADTVDSIREYDPATQASVLRVPECRITLVQRGRFRKPGPADRPASLLDYLPAGSLCAFLEPEQIRARVNEAFQRGSDARVPLGWDRFEAEAGRFARLSLASLPHDPEEEGVDFVIRSVHRTTPGIEGAISGFRELIRQKKKS
jgi:transcription-repair coupling factor (superfamily II helicase)